MKIREEINNVDKTIKINENKILFLKKIKLKNFQPDLSRERRPN